MKAHVGILGGGQLARMLLLSGYPLGLEGSALVADQREPAAQVCGRASVGQIDDVAALRRYLTFCEAVTFESEFVDIRQFKRACPKNVYVFPKADVIARIQDRRTQKELLDGFRIPTSPWRLVDDADGLEAAERAFPRGFVLKQRRFGYDGYGTFFARQGRAQTGWLSKTDSGFIAEALVPFRRELAVLLVRGLDGAFVQLPLVETVQTDGRCFSVHGPVTHPGLRPLTKRVRRMMDAIDYVGVLAVEIFDVGAKLLVNELAPRVHNSGHYSQQALACDQFEYHLRAGLGLPLPKPRLLTPGFAMVNLLGGGGQTNLNYDGPGRLHWYGKAANRPGRKLGHLNVIDQTPRRALNRALRWRKDFEL